MIFSERKEFPTETRWIKCRQVGPEEAAEIPIFVYADVLEELAYHASQRGAWGMVTGHGYVKPKSESLTPEDNSGQKECDLEKSDTMSSEKVDKAQSSLKSEEEKDETDYVEMTAFRDVFSAKDALDYASYLRRMKYYRKCDGPEVVLGAVCMIPEERELMLEDMLLMRTYFGASFQFLMFVPGNGREARLWRLSADGEAFIEQGYKVLTLDEC